MPCWRTWRLLPHRCGLWCVERRASGGGETPHSAVNAGGTNRKGSVTKRLLARHGSVYSQERLLEERDKTGEHTRTPRYPNVHARPRPCHRVPHLALPAPRDSHV